MKLKIMQPLFSSVRPWVSLGLGLGMMLSLAGCGFSDKMTGVGKLSTVTASLGESGAGSGASPDATPTPSGDSSASPSSGVGPVSGGNPTSTPAPEATPTPTPGPTPTPSATPAPYASPTPVPSKTPCPSASPTPTPTTCPVTYDDGDPDPGDDADEHKAHHCHHSCSLMCDMDGVSMIHAASGTIAQISVMMAGSSTWQALPITGTPVDLFRLDETVSSLLSSAVLPQGALQRVKVSFSRLSVVLNDGTMWPVSIPGSADNSVVISVIDSVACPGTGAIDISLHFDLRCRFRMEGTKTQPEGFQLRPVVHAH